MGTSTSSEFRKTRAARREGFKRGAANWGDVNAENLTNAVAWTAANGGALRLGYTRDGGAYAIGIYMDGESETEYVRPDEDIDQWLIDLAEDMKATYNLSRL